MASDNYYYEIDLDNKFIDLRYDFEYFVSVSKLDKIINTKKRKLIKRVKLTEVQIKELKEFFDKMIKNDVLAENNEENDSFYYYYSLETKEKSLYIRNKDYVETLQQILRKIDKDLNK